MPIEPADLERAAERAGRDGRLVEAIRLLFRACILRIERTERRQLRPGFTNRELLRRYRDTPFIVPLDWFVATIDAKWYGDEPCTESDYDAGRQQHEQFCGLIGK